MELEMTTSTKLTDQWNDFLLRSLDPYAMAKYDLLLDWMGDLKDAKILVAGCGSGEFCAFLAQRGAAVDAFDIDEKNIKLAQETARRLNVSFQTFVSTIAGFDKPNAYDFVVATDVIEHIEDDAGAVAKLKSLVTKSGSLVITVPALNSLMGYHDEILGHFRRYTKATLRKLIEPDFKIERLRYFGFFLIPITLLVSRILRKPYPVAAVGQVKESNSMGGKVLGGFFQMERRLNMGLGTSLLLIAKSL